MTDTTEIEPAPALPRGLNITLTLAAAIIVVAGLKAFSDSVGPLFLALVVVVAVSPVQGAVLRRGAPSWLAMIVLLIVSYGVILAIVAAVAWSATELVGLVAGDTYATELQAARDDVAALAEKYGVAGDDLEGLLDIVDIRTLASQLVSALSGLLGLLAMISLVLFTMVFMVMDAEKFGRNLDYVAKTRPTVATGLREFASSTRSYFVVSSIFGLIVAIFDTVALVILGVPLALVWGVLAFITNYIPNIGFVIGLIPPAIIAFFEGGFRLSLTVIIIYTVLNVVIQSVIQPKFVGDAVGLSVTLTFVSLIFWGWILGPLGALLAVPLTLFAKALLIDIDPTTTWASPLIALDDKHLLVEPEQPDAAS